MYVTVPFHWFEQHPRLSDLYVGFCGDCHVVNKPLLYTYFSVCLDAF